jgi:hypothetical protein
MDIVDYSMPLMKLEKLTRQMHSLCLEGKYMEAADLTQHVLVEARILSASLAIMHEANVKLNSDRALTAMAEDAKMLGVDL